MLRSGTLIRLGLTATYNATHLWSRFVKHKDARIGTAVERHAECVEALLSCGVPQLVVHAPVSANTATTVMT